jgi:hypothetical protein
MNKCDDPIRRQLWVEVYRTERTRWSIAPAAEMADEAVKKYDALFYPGGQENTTSVFVKKDFEVLEFIHYRLVTLYCEHEDTDFVAGLKEIIDKMEGAVG